MRAMERDDSAFFFKAYPGSPAFNQVGPGRDQQTLDGRPLNIRRNRFAKDRGQRFSLSAVHSMTVMIAIAAIISRQS